MNEDPSGQRQACFLLKRARIQTGSLECFFLGSGLKTPALQARKFSGQRIH